jgi:hypothetical protein
MGNSPGLLPIFHKNLCKLQAMRYNLDCRAASQNIYIVKSERRGIITML